MTEFESDTDAVLARSGFYRLLARIFRAEPDEALMGQIVAPPLSEALAEAGIDMAAILPAAPMGDIIRALAEEYTRLFLGPGKHISPHESVQLKRGSGVLWGPETGIVKRFIGEAGFDYDETYHGLPDHISVELEFLAHLVEQEANRRCAAAVGNRLAAPVRLETSRQMGGDLRAQGKGRGGSALLSCFRGPVARLPGDREIHTRHIPLRAWSARQAQEFRKAGLNPGPTQSPI
jgi:TorA maturation chaperone TorD